ncbi:MAG: sigma-70 family RNA polymerase sigma factor [Rhodobacteraceae bacterium]|nr:sigma-70 family RNA polymerase sigma factor [Paracoccaceae bacterium]
MTSVSIHATKPDAILGGLGYARTYHSSHALKGAEALPEPDPTEPNWTDLVIRVRDEQDEAAFALLFNHFAPRIKGFLMKSGADAAAAEECAQDVMVTLWQKAAQFDPTRASAATWIFTIARNRRIDVFRRQNRPEPTDLPWGPEPEAEAADALALQQETRKLSAALDALPAKQKDIVKRAFYGELSHAELAEETGLPLGTIKSRIRLALERLRRAMS